MAEKRPETSGASGINTTRFLDGTADSTPSSTNMAVSSRVLRHSLKNLKHVSLPFTTTGVDSGDTFTLHDGTTYFAPGMRIVQAMWQPNDPTTDVVTVSVNDAGTVATFVTAGTGMIGRLNLWCTG